jgi:hypothetical protein
MGANSLDAVSCIAVKLEISGFDRKDRTILEMHSGG